jgi:hypothetical protein
MEVLLKSQFIKVMLEEGQSVQRLMLTVLYDILFDFVIQYHLHLQNVAIDLILIRQTAQKQSFRMSKRYIILDHTYM